MGGRYLFGGADDGSVPFSWNGASASSLGDQTTVSAQIGSQRMVAQNDPGSSVFMGIATGNGSYTVTAASTNSGSAAVTSSALADAALWDGGSYTLRFTAADQYGIVDASNAILQSGSSSEGGTISFRGASLRFSGVPASGGDFSLTPSSAAGPVRDDRPDGDAADPASG